MSPSEFKVAHKSRAQDRQLLFFDVVTLSLGLARVTTGDFFEVAAASVSRGTLLRTSSDCDICPDLYHSPGLYSEIKAVGRSGSAIIYDHRLAKDRRFIDNTGSQLHYWFWRHTFKVTEAETPSELRAGLSQAVTKLFILDFPTLERILLSRPVKVLNTAGVSRNGKAIGYGGKGYGHGWSLTMTSIEEYCTLVRELPPTQAYGEHLKTIPVYLSHGEQEIFLPKALNETGGHETNPAPRTDSDLTCPS